MKRERRRGVPSERKDILTHRSERALSASGRPPRSTGTVSGGRRNRRRVPLVVAWNARLRSLRNWLLLCLLVETVWLTLNSPLLVVEKVTVSGAAARTPQEIAGLARLTRPGNIFRAPTRQAVKLLSGLPEVASVRVERRLPSTLAIFVKERTPVASVLTPGGRWVIDDTGFVFRSVSAPLPDVPVLMVRPTGPVAIGKQLPMTALPEAVASLRAIPRLPLARNVEFHVEDNGGAWLRNDNGLKIRLGQLDDAPGRLPLTERMLTGPNGPDILTKLLVLDVTSPGNEYTKRRPEFETFRFAGNETQ